MELRIVVFHCHEPLSDGNPNVQILTIMMAAMMAFIEYNALGYSYGNDERTGWWMPLRSINTKS